MLGKTLGVPLFQEQAMKIAIRRAGFTPGEADKLRRAMATFSRAGSSQTFATSMIAGMVARGYEREFAERCFQQIEGFGAYGFPESHAASFALLVYASCLAEMPLSRRFRLAALLNSQPMGFYAPAQTLRDAREHGVEVREVDVNASDWDCTLERGADDAPPQPSPREREGERACTAPRRDGRGYLRPPRAAAGLSPGPRRGARRRCACSSTRRGSGLRFRARSMAAHRPRPRRARKARRTPTPSLASASTRREALWAVTG